MEVERDGARRNGTVELGLAYAKPCRARHPISDFIKRLTTTNWEQRHLSHVGLRRRI